MCGDHGVGHLVGRLDDRQPRAEHGHSGGGAYGANLHADVEQEVRLMYAWGDIEADVFHRLMEMVQAGQLTLGDLAHMQSQMSREVQTDQARAADRSSQLATPPETNHRLRRLEVEADRLRGEARIAEEKAEAAQSKEDVFAWLEVKQGALYRLVELEERMAALRQD